MVSPRSRKLWTTDSLELVRVDAAHEVVLAVVLAEPQVAIGQHREGASVHIGHALSHRNLGLDAATLEQARTLKPQVKDS